MKDCMLNLNKKATLDFLLSKNSYVTYPLNNFLEMRFWYMITRLCNLVQLSIYSTRHCFI